MANLSTRNWVIDDGFIGYCSWTYDVMVDKYEWTWEWIDSSCEEYENGECVHVNTAISYTDCDGNIIQHETNKYQKCCHATNDPNCNHESIDASPCTEVDDISLKYLECWYSSDVYKQYISDDNVTDINCDDTIYIIHKSRI